MNTEIANTESLLLREYRVKFLEVTGQNILSTKYLSLFYVCVSLKTPYLMYIVDSLTLNSQSIALYLTPE